MLAAFIEGRTLLGKTLFSVAVMSLGTDYLPIPTLTDNLWLASMFGGVMLGYGLGLVQRAEANTGGTALVSLLLRRLIPYVSIAWILFAVDFVVVALSVWVFNIELAMYALIALYISSKVYDNVIMGFSAGKSIYIVTDEADAIAQRIFKEVERGCTRIDARGMFTGEPRNMMLCIVKSARELVRVKRIVREMDDRAFVFVNEVKEVLGEGFGYNRGH